jgi:hypothetical protein
MNYKVLEASGNNILTYTKVPESEYGTSQHYDTLLVSLSNGGLPYKAAFHGYDSNFEWCRVYIELQRDEDDRVTYFNRVVRSYKSREIDVTWGKLEYDGDNLISYKDSDGNEWKKEWGIPLLEYRILILIEQSEFTLVMFHSSLKDIILDKTPNATTFLIH